MKKPELAPIDVTEAELEAITGTFKPWPKLIKDAGIFAKLCPEYTEKRKAFRKAPAFIQTRYETLEEASERLNGRLTGPISDFVDQASLTHTLAVLRAAGVDLKAQARYRIAHADLKLAMDCAFQHDFALAVEYICVSDDVIVWLSIEEFAALYGIVELKGMK